MNKDYSDFYYHDIDGDGLPYSCPVNPVHTVFALRGTAEALKKAASLVTESWIGNAKLFPDYEGVSLSYKLGYYIIDIEMNNFIADLYDTLKGIPGVENVLYYVYDMAHKQLITNDRKNTLLSLLNLPDYEPEIDDDYALFPVATELSLPTE